MTNIIEIAELVGVAFHGTTANDDVNVADFSLQRSICSGKETSNTTVHADDKSPFDAIAI